MSWNYQKKPKEQWRSWKHGESSGHKHSRRPTPEYATWASMHKRCRIKTNPSYHHYGGRGITVCERWNVYENFLADMGRRPSPRHSIDRVNNDGNYEPGNCRWATGSEQINNRRPVPKRLPNPIDNRTRYWGLKYAMAALSFGA